MTCAKYSRGSLRTDEYPKDTKHEDLPEAAVDTNPVLPLELCPHTSKFGFTTPCRLDVVHHVDMDIGQDHNFLAKSATFLRGTTSFIDDGAKDNTSLCAADFDVGLQRLESMGRDGVGGRWSDNLQVTQRAEVEAKILKGMRCLVHK